MIPKMGETGRDVVTGFQGVVTATIRYLTGCNQLSLQPVAKEDGTVPEPRWFDETRVNRIGTDCIVIESVETASTQSQRKGPGLPPFGRAMDSKPMGR